jgi:hypothetical protein
MIKPSGKQDPKGNIDIIDETEFVIKKDKFKPISEADNYTPVAKITTEEHAKDNVHPSSGGPYETAEAKHDCLLKHPEKVNPSEGIDKN